MKTEDYQDLILLEQQAFKHWLLQLKNLETTEQFLQALRDKIKKAESAVTQTA